MAGIERKGYPAGKGEHRQISADTVNSVTEEALASEGRGVQEDALMSGGSVGVEDGTGAASLKERKPHHY